MDIVIPYRQRRYSDRDLLFTLRSAELHIPHEKLFIVGDAPLLETHLDGFSFIPGEDRPGVDSIAQNIHDKILEACLEPAVSEDFILMSDDHYLTAEFNPEPVFDGLISSKMLNYNLLDVRYRLLNNTLQDLSLFGTSTRFYDVHRPFIINKTLYLTACATATDWTRRGGYAIKSLYANALGLQGEPGRDLKLKTKLSHARDYEKLVGSRGWFSTGEEGHCPALFQYLNYLYSKPSRYELLST